MRREGASPEDAADEVQGFFARMLKKNNSVPPILTSAGFRRFLSMRSRNIGPRSFAQNWRISVVAVKVFFIDLAGLDQLYRIVAFIVLGVVVLVMSSLYLKYRHRFEMNPEDTAKKESES